VSNRLEGRCFVGEPLGMTVTVSVVVTVVVTVVVFVVVQPCVVNVAVQTTHEMNVRSGNSKEKF
jgi:hypothetical protein